MTCIGTAAQRHRYEDAAQREPFRVQAAVLTTGVCGVALGPPVAVAVVRAVVVHICRQQAAATRAHIRIAQDDLGKDDRRITHNAIAR